MTRILLLGGTTEASLMAQALRTARLDAIFSYAGRTASPVAQPLQTRVGGFGGIEGMVTYLRDNAITHLIDCTHPFAAQISRNAIAACALTAIPLIALQRPEWRAVPGDSFTHVADIAQAVAALPEAPARVFLAIGKQNLGVFADQPQHHYLLRLVDPPEEPPPLPDCHVILARGPFDLAGDTLLLRQHAISHIVAKNAGGSGARAKLDAARALGVPVIMINRPALPFRLVVQKVEDVLRWLVHPARLGV
jgi:precorrin-6A/cobalt-precorrin-6A reductase